jgi:hypothetical protein
MSLVIGKKIEQVLKQRGMSVKEFGRRINKSYGTVYDIFERDSMDTGLLSTIGNVLEHDFFQYFHTTVSPASAPTKPRYKVTIMLELEDQADADRVLRLAIGEQAFKQLKI